MYTEMIWPVLCLALSQTGMTIDQIFNLTIVELDLFARIFFKR